MPPRISIPVIAKPFSASPLTRVSREPCKIDIRAGSFEARQRRRHDPFLMAQSRRRKAANISRQQALLEERQAALGDPVKSEPTPFIQQIEAIQTGKSQVTGSPNPSHWNHYIKPEEFSAALEYSKDLTQPLSPKDTHTADPLEHNKKVQQHSSSHQNAEEAMQRILHLANGKTQDRTRVNIENCIETFGRHNTDKVLPSKPAAVTSGNHPTKTPRAGPDTGSPEVQVAILTTKILNLSRHLQTTNKDRHNKRNLRILVHKRQKLLSYLRRKERGGPRWQNLIQSLGLSDASWKGEISM